MAVYFGELNPVQTTTTRPQGPNDAVLPTSNTELFTNPLKGTLNFNQNTDWTTFSKDLTITSPGTKRLYLLWYNDNSGGTQPPVAVDNVSIQVPVTCSVPTIIGINSDTVLSWTAGSTGTPASYTLEYGIDGSETLTSVTVTDTFYAFHNLTLGATYAYRLKANCGAADGE